VPGARSRAGTVASDTSFRTFPGNACLAACATANDHGECEGDEGERQEGDESASRYEPGRGCEHRSRHDGRPEGARHTYPEGGRLPVQARQQPAHHEMMRISGKGVPLPEMTLELVPPPTDTGPPGA